MYSSLDNNKEEDNNKEDNSLNLEKLFFLIENIKEYLLLIEDDAEIENNIKEIEKDKIEIEEENRNKK